MHSRCFVWFFMSLLGWVLTKTAGFRRDSVPAGIAAVRSLGNEHAFIVDASRDAAVFTDENLARYRVAVFLNTTGDILDPDQQAAFERFIRKGGGFVGIHSATDTEYDWPWYGLLAGAYFASHPDIQRATASVVDSNHPSTASLPQEWTRSDEWYNFREDPAPRVKVLVTINETTYGGGTMGPRHPISWYHEFDGGRAWYTAMGHTVESYGDPLFLAHILGGIVWAAGAPLSDVEQGRVRCGYVIVTPDVNSATPAASETFEIVSGGAVQSQAGTSALPMTTDASLFAEVIPEMSRNLGVAITNPGNLANAVTITLRDAAGLITGAPVTVLLQPLEQTAKFVSELFSIGTGFTGSVRVQSSLPISVFGLRFAAAAFSAS